MSSRVRSYSVFRIVVCVQLMGCAVLFFGCAEMLSESGWENPDLTSNNYALASNGGRIIVCEEDMERPGSGDTLNNGITSSELWDQGEGWQCHFSGTLLNSARSTFRTDESRVKNTAMGWVIVEFPKVVTINRVVVYTVDSPRYPAHKYGVRDLGIYFQEDDDSPWFLVEPRARNIGVKSGRLYGNQSGVIDCRINARQAKRIRILVEETNDSKQLSPWRSYLYSDNYVWFAALARQLEGTVRLVEIEAYGAQRIATSSPVVRLGIRGQEISADIAEEIDLASEYGILLLGLEEGSPAAKKRAEINIGERRIVHQGVEYLVDSDILVDIDGSEIREVEDIKRILATREVGDTIKLGIISSSGQRKNVSIYLEPGPGNEGDSRDRPEPVAELRRSTRSSQTGLVGKPAPSFALRDLNSKEIGLADFRGKVVVLDFWATWCAPCVKEIPHFIELYKEYKEQDFMMLGVSVDNGTRVVESFARKHQVNYPILMADSEVRQAYGGIPSIPTTFVIDKTGRIQRQYIGYRDKSVFEADIRALLAE